MMKTEIERRFTAKLEVRKTGEKTTLVGLAVPYGATSADLGFRETIAPGAFSKHLASNPDVRALVEHDDARIIGRTKAGTMTLAESDDGVHVEIVPPNSPSGEDIIESVRRGDLSAMSFGFRTIADTWSTVAAEPHRTVLEAELIDVSIVASPAYTATHIEVAKRALTAQMEKNKMEPVIVPPAEPKIEPAPERRTAPIGAPAPDAPTEWRDYHTGKEVRVLAKNQKFSDIYRSPEPLSIGRAIRAMVVGDWTGAEAEQRALSTTSNPTAGFLVPNPLAARVIDLARAKSVLARAGAQTVDMTSGSLTIARVNADATFESKAENALFAGSDVVFDAINLYTHTIGTVVKMSRELAADAPNSVQLIENVLAQALAAKIDYLGLRGSGSEEPLGLLVSELIEDEAVSGALGYDKILDAMLIVEEANHESNTLVLSPKNANVLRKLKVASEANHFAVAPPAVASLNTLVTTAVPDSTAVVGDFSKFIIGLRQGPMLEVSTDAGDAFERHQVAIKITWRGAFNYERADAFARLTAIS